MTDQLPDVELHAVLRPDGTGRVDLDGVSEELPSGTEAAGRAHIIARAADRARALGRPVLLLTQEAKGEVRLIVSPSGEAESPIDTAPMAQRRISFASELRPPKHKRPVVSRRIETARPDEPAAAPPVEGEAALTQDEREEAPEPAADRPEGADRADPAGERTGRPSFLAEQRTP
ncbi:MAG: hypothetical protein QOC59_72, partial [Microbacteriaceae bacterium]|nr:hypothetical protein [Microbacteriaceae bacterium]